MAMKKKTRQYHVAVKPGEKRNGARQRSEAARNRDIVEIIKLYVKGYTFRQIAEEISRQFEYDPPLSHQAISNDIHKVLDEWKEHMFDSIESMRASELTRLNNIERVNWQAWEKSQTTENPAGDMRCMEKIAWCSEQRSKLFGLYAPTKISPTSPDGQSPWSFTDEKLQEIIDAGKLTDSGV